MAFPPEDDDIYESSGGRFDGSVYTIVKGPGGQFKYDASLSSSFEMPHPSEVLETISGEDLDTLIQDIGIDEYENLDSQFEQSSTREKLSILQDCFRAIGDTYTDIAIAKFDGIEAYVLCVAPSAGQAQSLGDDIIKEIQTRMEDGTLHESVEPEEGWCLVSRRSGKIVGAIWTDPRDAVKRGKANDDTMLKYGKRASDGSNKYIATMAVSPDIGEFLSR
jgi:hypothetical protein